MLGDCSEELSADDALAAKVEAMATQIVAAEGAASVADTVFVAEIRFEVRKLGFPHEAGTAVAANVAGVAARECCDVRAAGEFTWELVSTVRSSGVSEYPPPAQSGCSPRLRWRYLQSCYMQRCRQAPGRSRQAGRPERQ